MKRSQQNLSREDAGMTLRDPSFGCSRSHGVVLARYPCHPPLMAHRIRMLFRDLMVEFACI